MKPPKGTLGQLASFAQSAGRKIEVLDGTLNVEFAAAGTRRWVGCKVHPKHKCVLIIGGTVPIEEHQLEFAAVTERQRQVFLFTIRQFAAAHNLEIQMHMGGNTQWSWTFGDRLYFAAITKDRFLRRARKVASASAYAHWLFWATILEKMVV